MSKNLENVKTNKLLNNSKLITNSKVKKIDSLIKSQKMANYRILQKNLVYVIGLSQKLANKELLSKHEYFGQYGHMSKIVVNKNNAYYSDNQSKPSYSAYISYSNSYEAALTILAIDSVVVDDHLIRASFGTTKYCTFFLKNLECTNKECLYLHSISEDEVIVNKDELTSNISSINKEIKNVFYEQHLLAIKITNLYDKDTRTQLANMSKKKTVFPNLESIYKKEIVVENDPNNQKMNQNSIKKVNSTSNPQLLLSYATPKNKSEIRNEKLLSSKSQELISNDSKSVISDSNSISNCGELNKPFNNSIKPNLYRNRDRSRFPFVLNLEDEILNKNSSTDCTQSYIPEYVFDVINRKASRYTFFKKFENDFQVRDDNIYYEKLKCRDKDDSWTEFIFKNINLHTD